ncbi:MAG: lactonase family protein, partial [SAR202 cluster bacterium]|nr:lactonase family protein [SAR202 cluster bacterium]
ASKGIYLSSLDLDTGQLSPARLVAESENPSFLALHPRGGYLYAVNEVGNFGGAASGGVSAFRVNRRTGDLTFLNSQPSQGAAPCHLVVDRTGKNVLVANYTGGSVASLPLERDGKLKPASAFHQHVGTSTNPRRQEAPHAHSINLDRRNRFAAAADLGLDKVLVYAFDPKKGTLTANNPPSVSVAPGSGPRHFAFHPRKPYAYVINEILLTVTGFAWDSEAGVLTPLETVSTLPPGTTGNNLSTAEVQVHPSGKFLYGSNRGHHTIAIFRIDQKTGRLTPVGHQSTQGRTPRNFGIDPTGRFLLAANQDTDNVAVFRINQQSGELTPTGQVLSVPVPVCVKFMLPESEGGY